MSIPILAIQRSRPSVICHSVEGEALRVVVVGEMHPSVCFLQAHYPGSHQCTEKRSPNFSQKSLVLGGPRLVVRWVVRDAMPRTSFSVSPMSLPTLAELRWSLLCFNQPSWMFMQNFPIIHKGCRNREHWIIIMHHMPFLTCRNHMRHMSTEATTDNGSPSGAPQQDLLGGL